MSNHPQPHRRPAAAPIGAPLRQLARLAQRCTACPLYARATQSVFGEGPESAQLVLIGEQPGDQEDLQGRPFVGPAGKLLFAMLAEVGIGRSEVYVTNAVKHFKWEPRGKRRIHQRPSSRELAACRPWLHAELARIQPRVVVCLGATAAQTLFGPSFRVTKRRGELIVSEWAPYVLATVHPSSLLRLPDSNARQEARELFQKDLRQIAELLHRAGSQRP